MKKLLMLVLFIPVGLFYVIRRLMPFTFYEYHILDGTGTKVSPVMNRKKMRRRLEVAPKLVQDTLKDANTKLMCISSKGAIWAYSFRTDRWDEMSAEEYLSFRKP